MHGDGIDEVAIILSDDQRRQQHLINQRKTVREGKQKLSSREC